MDDEYVCKQCGDVWRFIPEDYDYISDNYPTICPLCEMPVIEMIREVFEEEGIRGVIKQMIKRYH